MSTQNQPDALAYAAAVTFSLAREEARDARNHRLLETGASSTWNQFRGRLGPNQLLALLAENAAVKFPVPFDPDVVMGVREPFESVPAETAEALIAEARAQSANISGTEYLLAQARRLGMNTRLARAELHVIKANQRVLELPGTGGQLAHYLTQKHDLPFREVFTIACSNWRELMLAGIAALDCRVVGEPKIVMDPELKVCRDQSFDVVIGLHPDKGGAFPVRQLEGWFPSNATKLVLI